MLLNEIKNIAKKESASFIVKKEGNKNIVYLSEEFKRCFPDEVKVTENFFINEIKKNFNNKIKITNSNNKIMLEAEEKENKPLNKPMRGDVKKYKVFVKDPKTGNIKKVNFGDKNMEIKRDDPERRKSFRARHKCDTAKDKTTPRYWSCKFWSGKSVSSLLNEIVDPDEVNVEKLNIKDNLCQDIWESEDKMKLEVRKALLKNAIEFIKFANLEDAYFKDIILTGSLANYNWHEGSDLDVHILMDFNQISDDNEFVGEYFRTKKALWLERYPIKIKKHDVEIYVQNINEPHTSTGVYSLLNDEWLTKPIKPMIAIDDANIQLKSADFMNVIDDLETSVNPVTAVDEIERLKEKLRNYRKAGLEDEGEFSTENLVFKILRNTGYLEKLSKLKERFLTQELTLENISMYTGGSLKPNIVETNNNMKNMVKSAIKRGTVAIGLVVALLSIGISTEEIEKDFGVPTEWIQKAKDFIQFNFNKDFEIEKDNDKIVKNN